MSERFERTVLAVLIFLFIVAGALMWVHPTAAIFTFFVGLTIALFSWVIDRWFAGARRSAAMKELQAHHCPSCGEEILPDPKHAGQWHCNACEATFADAGVELT